MLLFVLSVRNGSNLDLQEAVRLSSKSGGVVGFESLDRSGHWLALEELSQRMLQKVSC
jgi:hypothetical protein